MTTSPVRLRIAGAGKSLQVHGKLVIAGYTGSDVDQVKAHIEELAAIGVAPPPDVPMIYPVDWALLTTDPAITVAGAGTSGEVEPVLVRHGGAWYLGVGSDHTDRDIERDSVHESKKACPKPMAAEVIALGVDPVSGDFDQRWRESTLTSAVDGTAYQRGAGSAIRVPSDLLPRVLETAEPDDDLVVFCGTVPVIGGQLRPGSLFECQLSVPGAGPVTLSYTTRRHQQ